MPLNSSNLTDDDKSFMKESQNLQDWARGLDVAPNLPQAQESMQAYDGCNPLLNNK